MKIPNSGKTVAFWFWHETNFVAKMSLDVDRCNATCFRFLDNL